jgi:hypothetical protein
MITFVLLNRATAEGIANGSITLVLRRWDAPRARPGGSQRTVAGTIRIDDVTEYPGRYRVFVPASERHLSDFGAEPARVGGSNVIHSGSDLFIGKMTCRVTPRRLSLAVAQRRAPNMPAG